MRDLRFCCICLFLAGALLALAACAGVQPGGGVQRPAVQSAELQFAGPASGDTIAVFDTTAGEFCAVLYPALAPQACQNFITLAQQGYYDGLAFTRVEPGFVVEAGLDAEGAGTTIWGGSGYPAEVTDRLHHYAGALCMAINDAGRATSVFYVVQAAPGSVGEALQSQMAQTGWRQEVIDAYAAAGGAPYLDYTDTVFGQVYEGMAAVDAIGGAEVDEAGAPVEAITIRSVRIETYGG